MVASANLARRGPLVEGAVEELEFVRLDLVVICSCFWDAWIGSVSWDPPEWSTMLTGDTGSKSMGDVGVIAIE